MSGDGMSCTASATETTATTTGLLINGTETSGYSIVVDPQRFEHNIHYFSIRVITMQHKFKKYSTYWPRK
jgi:hypothetical protein